MALTEEQTAALQTLAAADPKEVADGLKEHAPNVYQTAFRVGYGTAKGEFEPKVKAQAEQVDALTAELRTTHEQVTALSGKDADFSAERERLTKAAQEAKATAEQAKKDAEASVKRFYQAAQEKALLAKLTPTVDPLYAENAVVPAARARIRVDGIAEDGTPQVSYLDADGVPLSGGLDALAQQLAATVDPRFKTSRVDHGGGAQNGSPAGSTGYDPAKAGREMAERQKAAAQDSELAFR